MPKVERSILCDHKNLVNYIKSSFSNPAAPGNVTVWRMLDFEVNNVRIFIVHQIYTIGMPPRHCVVISHNGRSQIFFCRTDTFNTKAAGFADGKELESYTDKLLANYNPSKTYSGKDNFFLNLTNDGKGLFAEKEYGANHSHISEYLYNSVRYSPLPAAPAGVINCHINGVDFSAGFFAFDTAKPSMDYYVISCNGRSKAGFLECFPPVPKRAKPDNFYYTYNKAVAILNSYNPLAVGEENNFNNK